MLHYGGVDPVVLGVGADELDVDRLKPVGNSGNQPIIAALDVEHDAIVADEAGTGVLVLDVLWSLPAGGKGFVVPTSPRF